MSAGRWSRATAVTACLALLAGCGSTVAGRTAQSGQPSGESLGGPQAQGSGGAAGDQSATDVPGAQLPAGSAGQLSNSAGSTGSASRSAAPQRPTATGGAIPTTGPGWDAKSVYIGVSTEEDLHRYAASFGISFDPGSIKGDAQAVIDDINAQGGLFGRKLVGIFHDNGSAELQTNPAPLAQQNCSDFTQDHRVIAVLNPVAPIDNENFRECLRRAHTPLASMGYATYDDQIYREAGPFIWSLMMPSLNRLMPAWFAGLKRQSYFTGWDASNGAPGSAPVKVGILEPDTPIGNRTAGLIRSQLSQAGVTDVAQFLYKEDTSSYASDMSSAVLRFRSAGVTHVLNLSNIAAAWLVFMETAEQQGFRPRYGLTTFNLGESGAQNGMGRQLTGSVGVGWVPGSDVDAGHFPPANDAQKACRAALQRGGQSFADNSQALALWVGLVLCDSLKMISTAAVRGGGLTPEQISAGLAALGEGFQMASTFANGLTPANRGAPGSVRDLYYIPSCTCFAYQGPAHPL